MTAGDTLAASRPFAITAGGVAIPAPGFGTSGMQSATTPENVATALKAGYRHIDTARKYGSEQAVGEGMRASGVPRQDIFLVTKVSHEYLRADDFARSVDDSLKALHRIEWSAPWHADRKKAQCN